MQQRLILSDNAGSLWQKAVGLQDCVTRRRLADALCVNLCSAAALSIVALVSFVVIELCIQAVPAMKAFGLSFLVSSQWNPVKDLYGACPQIVGTLAAAGLAMLVAMPVGLLTAVFLTQKFLPPKLQAVLWCLVELLAAVPSVVYGMWGIFVLIPFLEAPCNSLFNQLNGFPLFSTPMSGPGLLPAAMVLAVMVLPTIAALSRDALRNVPAELGHGAYALGATRWETILKIMLPSARRGIAAAGMLALGRAVGETMATAMLIGNAQKLSWSIFSPGTTISAHLANQFAEASGLQLSALIYLAVILLAMAVIINLTAKFLSREEAA